MSITLLRGPGPKKPNLRGGLFRNGQLIPGNHGGSPSPPSGSTLRNQMTHYYDMDEASGGLVDKHASVDLVENGTIGASSGGGPNAQDVRQYTSGYGRITNDSFNPAVGQDFALSVWAYWDQHSDDRQIISISDASSMIYALYSRNPDSQQMRWEVQNQAGASFIAQGPTTIQLATWYHFVAMLEHGVGITLIENDGTPIFTAMTENIRVDSTDWFHVARNALIAGTRDFQGRIGMLGMWDRTLTAVEITQLHNSGNGLQYAGTA